MTFVVHMIGNAHLDPAWLWTWQAGLDDARRTLRQPRWLEDWDAATALRVFDIARGGG